jgi:hypothetical protein
MTSFVIDLFCGLGGWAEGFLAEGFDVIGFDLEKHDYGSGVYPGQLVLQDVLTVHGSQFRDAVGIVASPPCRFFSYMAMPWSRAKKLAAEVRQDKRRFEAELELFRACFRIQVEASEAARRYIPLIVENVRGAQPWVGPSRWNYGSYHLWGDVPALMPYGKAVKQPVDRRNRKKTGGWFYDNYQTSHRRWSSHSKERKAWTATIAKIPFPLARHIARYFKNL